MIQSLLFFFFYFSDIKPWDIIAELVKLNTYPPPLNPFSVDFSYFDELPANERLIASGALINFLQKMLASHKRDKPYTAKGIAKHI